MTEDRQQTCRQQTMQKQRNSKGAVLHNFRKLKIYQRAIVFIVDIYAMSQGFPNGEMYGLTSQVRRAAVSISLNIAEGSGTSTGKEFKRYLEIARRSTYEVMSCLEIAVRLSYCTKEDFERLSAEADEIAAMITGFSNGIQSDI
jgi:four helix bundle protein